MTAPVEASTFARSACRRWLLDEITAVTPAGVVTRNEPRDLADEAIWLADTTGTVDYPVSGRNLPRQDTFTVLVVCACTVAGDDPSEAEERVEVLASAVLAAVSGDPHAAVPVTGVIDIRVGAVDGPDPVPTAEGYGAVMTVAVEFDTRIVRP